MDLGDVVAVVNRERVGVLCLSQGGWEGWLQCEIWAYLNAEKNPAESVEREVRYPGADMYCDLVANGNLWIELKAFGAFREGDEKRFMDSIAKDVWKIDQRPEGTKGLVLVVVPKAIGEDLVKGFYERGWTGFNRQDEEYVSLFYLAC
ncbi:hypothetical protein ACJJIF_05150 [Microbulbifer sp. SSSA002]|uniref:hypothetical protein n=1 Tax=Microbulbifer sp. SSSA002 TaxID=3243376 RepID=UPI00403909CD